MEDGDSTPTHEALERLGLAFIALYVIAAVAISGEDTRFLGIAGLVLVVLGLIGRMMRESRD